MRPRLLLLLLAGLGIWALVAFREHQLTEWKKSPPPRLLNLRQLAPRFDLFDQHKHMVKLERFLGRDRVVLIFLGTVQDADTDSRLQRLRDCQPHWQEMDVVVVGVTIAGPLANKQAADRLADDLPMTLVSDFDKDVPLLAHRAWGRIDKKGQPLSGLFLINRDGTVAVDDQGQPLPVANEDAVLDQLCQGNWPR